jgi:hypothetical protein
VARFRKKPVEIEALQWTGANVVQIITFVGPKLRLAAPGSLVIETLEGRMAASPGDFIIKGIAGEFYPCKPDIFAQTYEPVLTDSTETELNRSKPLKKTG